MQEEEQKPAKAAEPAKKKVKATNGAAEDVAAAPAEGGETSVVFVKNLPWSVDNDSLYEFFKAGGCEAMDVRVGGSLRESCHQQWHRGDSWICFVLHSHGQGDGQVARFCACRVCQR